MAKVELRGFGWRHAGRRRPAVSGVDLRIDSGERVLLLGASGSGKSTLLTAMAGLLPDDSGEQTGHVTVDGRAARDARDRIGVVFQDPQTQLVMARAGDDVAFGLENRGADPAGIPAAVRRALDTVGFPYPADRATHALSGGEQQRLVLAGAIATGPRLLLLDEPTANLDPAGAALVREAISGVLTENPDTTMVLVEHRVAEALPLVDRVVVLGADGGVLADGPAAEVLHRHGERLAAQGVWVPGTPVDRPRRSPGTGPALVTAQRVGLRHPDADRAALAPTDLRIHAAELVAVTGANGSGKSTLARLVGGLSTPGTGAVYSTGDRRPLHRWRAAPLAARIGSVFQNPEHQFVTSRVRDELNLRPRRHADPPARIAARTTELLERLRLEHLAEANPFSLSGGEARRLSVATALATAPAVLVFDEPTFGQDRRTWRELTDLIAGLRDSGTGILVVSHDTDFVTAVADRRLSMVEGELCSA
ncbi:energy-coupling factor transport system ATP-binding protein [Stackebrandtia albiflava]|uniref:Energy-coupling factor transport system ATP-binding protein n=1 Tax=Stackebrandtia albiflava TaxID=406432 RepID=A0A562VAS7_9ACTN|nr:ATP-binding cassette domain-containing protein [Stackebrandtia albiflava]TWJ14958.1 energy-coupling factor transport system ATP-binding protein [Stackebrandtia albiflava]